MKSFEIEILPGAFAVHRLAPGTSFPSGIVERPFVWIARTEVELSIVCEDGLLDEVAVEKTEGSWRALRLAGPLDFGMVGVLAGLTALLAEAGIPIIALSSFDTDTILVRGPDLPRARAALESGGHLIHDPG